MNFRTFPTENKFGNFESLMGSPNEIFIALLGFLNSNPSLFSLQSLLHPGGISWKADWDGRKLQIRWEFLFDILSYFQVDQVSAISAWGKSNLLKFHEGDVYLYPCNLDYPSNDQEDVYLSFINYLGFTNVSFLKLFTQDISEKSLSHKNYYRVAEELEKFQLLEENN